MDNNLINPTDNTTNKIIIFAIGVLVGAMISTGAFCACTAMISANSNSGQTNSQGGGTPPEMPSGQSGQGSQGDQGSSSGSNSQNGQPPAKPGDNSQDSSSSQSSSSQSSNSQSKS